MSTNNNGHYSTKTAPDSTDEYNAMLYVIRNVLAGAHHCVLARVVAADANSVDVQPIVNMTDGDRNSIPHGVINGLSFVRLQGGSNAVIIDPKVGDIGIVIVADNDTSSAVAARGEANPGSMRRNDLADGVYLGGLLNQAPQQYVSFTDTGIKIYSPNSVKLEAPTVDIQCEQLTINASDSTTVTTGQFTVNGPSRLNGPVTATQSLAVSGTSTMSGTINAVGKITSDDDVSTGSVSLKGHVHGGVRAGGDNTGGPQ